MGRELEGRKWGEDKGGKEKKDVSEMKKEERKPPHLLEGLRGHPGKWLGGISPSGGVQLAIQVGCAGPGGTAVWGPEVGSSGHVGVKEARPRGGDFSISLGPSWGRWQGTPGERLRGACGGQGNCGSDSLSEDRDFLPPPLQHTNHPG